VILPTKHLSERRALLSLGAAIIEELDQPHGLSSLWHLMRQQYAGAELTFDWFVLSLDLLFALGAIEMRAGRLTRATA
jgi:hypothetical protein